MTSLALLSDVFGIRHTLDCRRLGRIFRDADGRWACNDCGRRATTGKEAGR